MLKTSAYGLGFQHLPRDLANVNAWKTMFDPYNVVSFEQLGTDCKNNTYVLLLLIADETKQERFNLPDSFLEIF